MMWLVRVALALGSATSNVNLRANEKADPAQLGQRTLRPNLSATFFRASIPSSINTKRSTSTAPTGLCCPSFPKQSILSISIHSFYKHQSLTFSCQQSSWVPLSTSKSCRSASSRMSSGSSFAFDAGRYVKQHRYNTFEIWKAEVTSLLMDIQLWLLPAG